MRNKFFMTGLMVMIAALMFTSCSVLQSMFEDKVVTTSDNLTEEGAATAVPADLGLIKLPPEVRERLEKSGQTVVIVDKDGVIDPAAAVEITEPGSEGWLDAVAGIGLGVANAVFPGVAALEALGLLFSRRKRKHYAAAVRAAAPTDGSVDFGEAVMSLGRAVGFAHSSEATKEVFEEETV